MIRFTHFHKLLSVLFFFTISFHGMGQGGREMTPSEFTYCELIVVNFSNKIGEESDIKELYLRCSVQDYFIKFCESAVTREELEPYINKGIKIKMNVVDGNWDICPDDFQDMQSRTGRYAVIESLELDEERDNDPPKEKRKKRKSKQ